MPKWPEEFSHIQALVLLNVVCGKTFFVAENPHLDPAKVAARLNERVRVLTGFRFYRVTTEVRITHCSRDVS